MHRWFGDASRSDQQASERNQRAARRTLKEQKLSYTSASEEDEENFLDANNSLSLPLNVDGGADSDFDSGSNTMADAAAAAELARQRALPVEDADFADDAEAWKKEIKTKFDLKQEYLKFRTSVSDKFMWMWLDHFHQVRECHTY